MPIFAKIIKVGDEQSPTQPKEEKPIKTFFNLRDIIGKLTNNPSPVIKGEPSPEIKVEPSKYVKKQDGDLIRHINTKSSYQKDMLDL